MKLTFLGTSAFWPSNRHNNVCFVAHAEQPVLFECGPSILHQLALAGIDPSDIRSIVVSHLHGDHALGLPMFLVASMIEQRTKPLTICLPASAIEGIQTICRILHGFTLDYVKNIVEWLPLPEGESGSFQLEGGIRATTTQADHGGTSCVSSHAFFEREHCELAFSGDTAYCERVAHNAAGTRLLIHESNWSRRLSARTGLGHSTATDAARIASLAKASRLALVHTDRTIVEHLDQVHAEAAGEFQGEVLIPADFSTIEV